MMLPRGSKSPQGRAQVVACAVREGVVMCRIRSMARVSMGDGLEQGKESTRSCKNNPSRSIENPHNLKRTTRPMFQYKRHFWIKKINKIMKKKKKHQKRKIENEGTEKKRERAH